MRATIKVKNTQERVVLSETLPYETPITFSNRYFYEFLVENELKIADDVASWKKISTARNSIICLLLGISNSEKSRIKTEDGLCSVRYIQNKLITIPFSYGISHKEKNLRRLSVVHPRNQLDVVNFYNKFKESILYSSEISSFSLRSPHRIATTRLYDDRKKSASVILTAELEKNNDKDYKNLKSFFGYRKINNIHQFFESFDYHKCEQKYNHMAQLDISKCFDSIYSHSIAWAVLGKKGVKHRVAKSGQDILKRTFADDFDRLLRTQNYNETNGILIGPEVSRIFAEVILQRIDSDLEKILASKGVVLGKDYNIYRYVDDYFIFYNDAETYRDIYHFLDGSLREYKLSVNSEKEVVYDKPIITEITIAKRKISNLLNDKLELELVKMEQAAGAKPELTPRINIQSKPLITEFKTVLSESGAEYKSVINYTLTIIEAKLKTIFENYSKASKDGKSYRSFLSSVHACIDFCFFIYTVAPRVNTTIKLSRTLNVIIDYSRSDNVKFDDMHQIFKLISDNIIFVIEKYENKSYTQVETLYLLTVLSELGKDYWLNESTLIGYFGGEYKDEALIFSSNLNYFSLVAVLFYIKEKVRYKNIKKAIKKTIVVKMRESINLLDKDTECFLLLMDCLSCPFLGNNFKHYLLKLYRINSPSDRRLIILDSSLRFTKWVNFEFGKELDAKQSDSVY
ncbi:MAG: hypothetical protein ACJAY0_000409 [Thalassolituus sp.]|jgi:hypothetical protein